MKFKELSHIQSINGPILVTGHTGFKGTWLTYLLESLNIEVIGLSLPPQPESLYTRASRTGNIKEAFFDIREPQLVDAFIEKHKPEIIIHLAAQSLVLESYKKPKYTFDVNVNGTLNILESAIKHNSTKIVLTTTTDKVYENSGLGKSFFESDPLKGKDPYSASKVAVENVIFAWQGISEMNNGPKLLTARSGNVIGGGDFSENRLMPDLVRAFSTNSELVIRNSMSTRPWQHVLDPITGYLMMIDSALGGSDLKVLNFGPSGKSLQVREVIKIATTFWKTSSDIIFEKNTNELEAKKLELNSTLARQELLWKPFWTQKNAIIETVNWWMDVISEKYTAEERCKKEIERLLASKYK